MHGQRNVKCVSCICVCERRLRLFHSLSAFVTFRLSMSTARLYKRITIPATPCNKMICIEHFHNV